MKQQRKRFPTRVVAVSTALACLFGSTAIAQGSTGDTGVQGGYTSTVERHRSFAPRQGYRHRHPTPIPTPTQTPQPVPVPTPTPEPVPVPTPTPTPTPAAVSPAGYKLFFEDEFDKGSLANFVQGSDNTGKVSVDQASGTATFTIPAGVSEPRMELSINKSNQHFTEGMKFVLELERWLAPGTVPAGPGHHFTIAQFKGLEGRFPMVSEEYGYYSSQGNGLYVQDKNKATNANFKIADYALSAWHTDRIAVTVSKVRQGSYTFTIDGAQVATSSGINTLESVDSYGFLKIGAYGQPEGKAIELKLRNIRLYVPA